ncbi:MAG: AMP-binding protein [Fibromonadaceae bacterium]|jgi:acyl-CoA synthetase (AMP-forming)/AMP-acid ligase II/3-hydroxymyristoyl/3-hydroxydecanoyl-(acyl carrier protein) dehydratase|nr:AMP-binding protein [Fibromonadaceae bacterium]
MNFTECYSENGVKTQVDFLRDVAALREFASKNPYNSYILHSENLYYFAVAFAGILQSKKNLAISANTGNEFIKEISDKESFFLPEEKIRNICSSSKEPFSVQWQPIDPQANIALWTSGTTGKPKKVDKTYNHLDIECSELANLWGNAAKDCLFCETVSHHHIYGLLCSFLLPLRIGAPFFAERIEMPGILKKLPNKEIVLVSSPAFLKRIPQADAFKNLPIFMVFCSGGVLPFESARYADSVLRKWPVEIYGSTETGGIAHRVSKNGLEWQPFSVCSLSLANNGCLSVESPYIIGGKFETGDLVNFLDNGKFELKGRIDSIVKIEEKRISLNEVEMRIMSSGLVQDVCVIALSSKRQYTAAAIILNEKGKEKFLEATEFQKNSFFKKELSKFLESAVIPKKWRYVETFTQNSQGKTKREEIEALFLPQTKENYQILSSSFENSEKGERKIIMDLLFPNHSDFFDGHFPQFSLLPAVAQVDTVIKLSNKYLNSPINLKKISKMKFMIPIRPDVKMKLHIRYLEKENTINFEIFSEQNKKHSSGKIFCG